MFDCRNDQVGVGRGCAENALECQIVRLRCSAGEDHLDGLGPEKFGHLGTGFSTAAAASSPKGMTGTGRVAEAFAEKRQHRLDTRGSVRVVAWLSR
ncbi:MAG: hypothetical protein CM1200mP2_14570 [Planctomycetaceae bacterium]|nr:MAG: hypothetical protein CM1200mP2_14570 [Planctomycetaceae bacterium]